MAKGNIDNGGARRQVTAVFIGIENFSTIASRADAEELHSRLDDYHRQARILIEASGGEVTEYLGDGVVAIFGLDRTEELSADRAVDAALRAVRSIRLTCRNRITVRLPAGGIDQPGTFVGRTRELARLIATGGPALIVGQAGVGKTASVGHLAGQFAAKSVFQGDAIGHGSSFLPFRDWLPDRIGTTNPDYAIRAKAFPQLDTPDRRAPALILGLPEGQGLIASRSSLALKALIEGALWRAILAPQQRWIAVAAAQGALFRRFIGRTWAFVMEEALAETEKGIAAFGQCVGTLRAIGANIGAAYFSAVPSSRLAAAGGHGEAWATSSRALAETQADGLHCWHAEILRLHGANCRATGRRVEAEAALAKAVEVATRQGAALWPVRARLDRIAAGGSADGLATSLTRFPATTPLPELAQARAQLGLS